MRHLPLETVNPKDYVDAISNFQPGYVAIIFTPSMNNISANMYKDCPNNLRKRSNVTEYQNQINHSKGLQIYWHQSEGIRPPFNRVDSVLLELPYDGLTDWFCFFIISLSAAPLLIATHVLMSFFSAIVSPGQTICHLGWYTANICWFFSIISPNKDVHKKWCCLSLLQCIVGPQGQLTKSLWLWFAG